MKRFYSQTTGCTYIQGIHPAMPEDAKEISPERYDAVIANPQPGKVRGHDETGLPILVDPPCDYVGEERIWRDTELASVVWLRDRHRDELDLGAESHLTPEQFEQLLAYLQALRNWPQSPDFPQIEHRPVAPPWIAEQTQ
ncbi:phage tail assembly chaperone [Pseudomonas protegens]|uniref:phage tail assembly chaperone n=1 Tax=Pseudomonas protegens TaxID=380021 RepID=UPI002263D903|nr:phage tail assembly chaperone [Pseudomonas protegens]